MPPSRNPRQLRCRRHQAALRRPRVSGLRPAVSRCELEQAIAPQASPLGDPVAFEADIPIYLIDEPGQLLLVREDLAQSDAIAIDSESNSLHAYREQVCFVQLRGQGPIYLVDTLRVTDLRVLEPVLGERGPRKIIHGADYDVTCVKRDFQLALAPVFDTMLASQILGSEHVGLGAVTERTCGVTLPKEHARHDWGARPLDPDYIPYLAGDVLYLHEIYKVLCSELEEVDRTEAAEIEFRRVEAMEWSRPTAPDPEAFRKVKGARTLDQEGLSILKELHSWREGLASKRNVPAFRVLGNAQLLHLARVKPRSVSALRNLKGIGPSTMRHGKRILQAIANGIDRKKSVPVRLKRSGERPDRKVQERVETLKDWRRDQAADEDVPTLVVLPNHVIGRLAEQPPKTIYELRQVEGMGERRTARYGDGILQILT